MRTALRAAVILSLAGLTGCATEMDGHTEAVSVQTLNDDVTPVDGTCVVSNKQGSWTVNTPGNVTVDRGRGKLSVACTAPGFQPGSATVAAEDNDDERGNMLLGGGVGVIVDLSSGAAYQYPNEIDVPMKPVPAQASASAAPATPAKS